MNNTQFLLKGLSSGELQQLAFELLPRISKKYKGIIHSGAVEGTFKTRKGTPDQWREKPDGGFIYIQVTTDSTKRKVLTDLEKSIKSLGKIKKMAQSEHVAFINFEPFPEEIEKCKKLCQQKGIGFDLFNNSRIAKYLDEPQNHDLRFKYLNIPPDISIFMTIDRFKERLERQSRKLPFSTAFVGREKEIQDIISLIQAGTRVIVIHGNPGVGKTRFCLELSKEIKKLENFQEYEIRFVRDINESLLSAIRSELDPRQKYIIVADDANRLGHLEGLSEILLDPYWAEGSLLIISTRSYHIKQVLKKLRNRFEDVRRLEIKRLSNADIDKILQNPPFSLQNREFRKKAVSMAEGNPRMAAIIAEVLKAKGFIANISFYERFKEYFEGVFSELQFYLEKDKKDKALLAIIAALRIINPSNERIVKKIISLIDFKNEWEFRESISRLSEYEILERWPSGKIVKIFDDSVSEYIVFRYFFDDKTKFLDFKKFIIEPFGEEFANHIFENLVTLTLNGYKSEELKRILNQLLKQSYDVLLGLSEEKERIKYLGWMEKFVYCVPEESFKIIYEYTKKKNLQNIPINEANLIIKIAQHALYIKGQNLLLPVTRLLREYALAQGKRSESLRKNACDALIKIFRYLPPIPKDDKHVYWIYTPQEILVNEVEKWIFNNPNEIEIQLIVNLLSQLCRHYFEIHETDYIDRNKFIMSVGLLHLSDKLKNIRKKVFSLLTHLYLMPSISQKLKIKIIDAFDSALFPWIPFGVTPSKELMEFDAKILLSCFEKLCAKETQFLLLDKLWKRLKRVEGILSDSRATVLRKSLETAELQKFQKFIETYWEEKQDLEWEAKEKEKERFAIELVSRVDQVNLKDFIADLSRIQRHASLENSHLLMMGQVFYHLGRLKPIVGELAIKEISRAKHPLFPYLHNLLMGISSTDVEQKRKIAREWLITGEIEKLRVIAASYAWKTHPYPAKEDIKIINALLSFQDEIIDEHLVNALQNFQDINADWVAKQLLVIAKRATPRIYSNLLIWIKPSGKPSDFHYQIYKTHPEIFKEIIFASVRFPKLSEAKLSHLINCLKYLSIQNLDVLLEYFLRQLNWYLKCQKERNYGYEVFPLYSFKLNFVRQHEQYREFLIKLLKICQKGSTYFYPCLDLLKSILEYEDSDDKGLKKLDNITFEVFLEWINGSEVQLKTIISILREIHPWQSWFELVRHIVKRTSDSDVWESLYSAFYFGDYKHRLKMIRQQRRENDSFEMHQFLNGAEKKLQEMIEREKERESEETELKRIYVN